MKQMYVTPEASFITCCTIEADSISAAAIDATAIAVTDWDTVVNTAENRGVSLFVLQQSASRQDIVPVSAAQALHETVLTAQAKVMLLELELRRISSATAGAGLQLMVLKGQALQRTLYHDAILRPYNDIDLNIRPEAVVSVVRIL